MSNILPFEMLKHRNFEEIRPWMLVNEILNDEAWLPVVWDRKLQYIDLQAAKISKTWELIDVLTQGNQHILYLEISKYNAKLIAYYLTQPKKEFNRGTWSYIWLHRWNSN